MDVVASVVADPQPAELVHQRDRLLHHVAVDPVGMIEAMHVERLVVALLRLVLSPRL
jgi:hypothetical protein